MKNNRKKIIAVVLLLVILVLGGVSIFVATRISSQQAVAPTAPTSKPKAAEFAAECGACGGNALNPLSCPTGMVCDTSGNPPGALDLPGKCVRKDSSGKILSACGWLASAECKIQSTIVPPPCTPRPGCLDEVKACKPAEPAGGYCPYLNCDRVKRVFKDVAGNTAGSYNFDDANEITATRSGERLVLYPGEQYVYMVPFTVTDQSAASGSSKVKSAVITDKLDARMEFVDGTTGCTEAGGTVTCTLTGLETMQGSSKAAFRVKIKDDATFSNLTNIATIESTSTTASVSGNAICYNNALITKAPAVRLACRRKVALNDSGNALINTIGKDKSFQYSFDLANDGDKVAPDVILTDVLPEKVAFVDSASGCTYDEATRKVTCKTSLNAGETKKVAFKAKTLNTVTDGEVITNKGVCKLESSAPDIAGSECERDLTVNLPFLTAVKKAYRDNSNNQAGSYQLTEEIDTVSKNQIFVYAIEMQNTGTGTASSVTITDPLTGDGQDQLTMVDRDPKCDWSTSDKLITCHIDIQPGGSGRIAFRVKVSDGIANGTVIKNTGKVLSEGQELTVNKDLNVSTIVACNHTCTSDAECESGYMCDSSAKKCRRPDCPTTESCVCPVAVTEAPTRIVTRVVTQAPTRVVTAPPTAAPTAPEMLDSGILDMPGVAAFGGGLLLAVIGLLLAL